jgi:DNA-binding transcriptional ArsR family regulator
MAMTTLAMVAAPRRREILRLVWQRERSAGEIHGAMPGVTFGAISQQLRLLRTAGLVSARREGRHRYYRARQEQLGELRGWLEAQWDDGLARLKALAEMEAARRGPRRGGGARR